MEAPLGMYRLARNTPSLRLIEPLLGGEPAPAGALFMLGEQGGFSAAPRRVHRLTLGRNAGAVHVTVGGDDANVSREHANVRCMTRGPHAWWILRNIGVLPVIVPDVPPLLQGQELVLPSGYTPLHIQGRRLHLVELLVSDGPKGADEVSPTTKTSNVSWPLTDREQLVLVVVFQHFLHRSTTAHPLTWKEASAALNEVPGQSDWNPKKAERVVETVRHKLSGAGMDGMDSESAHPETLKHNLLRFLLATGTIRPEHLSLLGDDERDQWADDWARSDDG